MSKSSSPHSFTIRKGKPDDIPQVFALIKELALYEKAPDEVDNTVEQMLLDGFGENPIYHFYVAESQTRVIVGIALYYFRYSTWKGRRMYLEDLIVTESYRGRGLGKLLFEVMIEEAKATHCTGMVWQVLDWNEPAIEFYKRYGADFDAGWINCSLKL
jgi:GNAT superfamily N-acetyltransferase